MLTIFEGLDVGCIEIGGFFLPFSRFIVQDVRIFASLQLKSPGQPSWSRHAYLHRGGGSSILERDKFEP